jgi:branched-chain amino acid transport system substrate-binding protein
VAMAKLAPEAGIKVTAQETLTKDMADLAPLMDRLKAGAPDALWVMPGSSTAAFFKAYEASGWKVPVTGRFDPGAAAGAVSAAFRSDGGLANLSAVSVFTPLIDKPQVKAFVTSYQAHYGLMPTQRSFFVYEGTLLAVDAIRRAQSDEPAAVEKALKSTKMPSLLGGSYAMDDHNHPHIPLFIVGLQDGKPAVIATE